ncbi:hypothetical protein [Thiocapsa sp.]|uniref:hypothetical protein n=1 Tax=Thiocapsa sp. TaxID=2024551 RepID=UPI0035941F25
MPKRTVFLIDKLSEMGLPDAVFRSLHHLGTPMDEHRTYCTVTSSFRPNKQGDRTNDLVRDRLQFLYDECKRRGLTSPIPAGIWEGLAAEAGIRLKLRQRRDSSFDQPGRDHGPESHIDDQLDATGKLDDVLLTAYMSEFFGYGTSNANFWFVGMEEGGGDNFKEIERRLSCWDQRGRRQLEDLRAFHEAFGEHRWHRDRRLQPTWRHLIRIYLSANFHSTDEDAVRDYQVDKLGREGGDTTLLELFPLPSPSTSNWRYETWSTLPSLASRESYKEKLIHPRFEGLNRLISENRPQAVVFYGTTYRNIWNRFIPTSGRFQRFEVAGSTIELSEHQGTAYAICAHPSAPGITSGYFSTLGRKLRPLLQEHT